MTLLRSSTAVLLFACAAACQSGAGRTEFPEPALSGAEPEAPSAAPELPTGPVVSASASPVAAPALAFVAGEPISIEQFLAHSLHRDSRAVYDTIDRLVTARLALAEAGRLGILLDPAQVDARVAAGRDDLAALLAERDKQLDRYLAEELGLDPTRYFELMRDEVVQQLLAERAMRSWSLAAERAELRVIVTDSEAEALTAIERLGAGEDFADLARELSRDPSAERGGQLPAVVRNELSPLARLAFRTPAGSHGGPIEEQGRWVLIFVEARPEPLSGDWDTIGAAVEADLAARPVEDPEYWQWRAAMGRRYQIDLSPLLELAGEPRTAR